MRIERRVKGCSYSDEGDMLMKDMLVTILVLFDVAEDRKLREK